MTENSHSRRRGSVLLVALIAVMVIAALATSMLTVNTGRTQERDTSIAATKSLYIAESGMSDAIERITAGNLAASVGASAEVGFSGGVYRFEIVDNGDNTCEVTAFGTYAGISRATRVVMEREGEGIYASALFAGNSSGDPAYDMKFGGSGTSADDINGNIYSGGNVLIDGDASLDGLVRASGTVSGGSFAPGMEPKTGASLPVPDIAAMNYEKNHDYDVVSLFSSATYASSSLGGKAWQLPEESPAHIFRKNPSDRTSNTSATTKDDYFLEDPYESVNSSSVVDAAHGTHITLSGQDGNPGSSGTDRVYFIDGNLWIHNPNIFSFTMYNAGSEPIRATFVVKGNIYISDNILYQGTGKDGIAFVTIKDADVPDSGNIYFGDPTFGTLERMDAFMYAENNFYDNNLSAVGSAKVTVNGNMTAGNQVRINRDAGKVHSKLTVNFDGRLIDDTLVLPGLPAASGVDPVWRVRSWNEVSANP